MPLSKTHKYDDIIHLPHPVSAKRAGMPMIDRAAQFAPFAALTGYEAVIEESGRLTDSIAELTESSIQAINDKLLLIAQHSRQQTPVEVTYFQPDSRKSGGSYVTVTGRVKRVDSDTQNLVLTDGRQIPLPAIYRLEESLSAGFTDTHEYPLPAFPPD